MDNPLQQATDEDKQNKNTTQNVLDTTNTNDVDKTRAFLQTTGGILALFIA
jgi:hypothetical protein